MKANYTEQYLQKTLPSPEQLESELDTYFDRWLFSDLQRETLKAVAKESPGLFRDVLISLLSERRDGMTGLSNKSMFMMRANEDLKNILQQPEWNSRVREANEKIATLLQSENPDRSQISRLRRELLGGLQLTIFASDMSSLKLVNDKMGHEYGDQFIKMVAEEIFTAFDNEFGLNSFVSRVGGDEFYVLNNGTDEERVAGESVFYNVNAAFEDIESGKYAKFKKEVSSRLEVTAFLDNASAHVSEGLALYIEICMVKKYSDVEYCNNPSAIETEDNHRAVKGIIDLTVRIADRRALLNKIVTKLIELYSYIEDPKIELMYSKKFRVEDSKLILGMLGELKGKSQPEIAQGLTRIAQKIANIDAERSERQRKSVDSLIDEIAVLGL